MPLSRAVLSIAVACCMFQPARLCAVEVAPVMVLDTPSSFVMKVTRMDGSIVEAKTYLSIGKRRAEFNANGLDLTVIAREDQNEMYGVFPRQHLMMQASLDNPLLARYQLFISAFSKKGRFDRIGPELCEGFSCMKYNVTSETGELYLFWYDPARQAPVKVVAASGRFSLVISDFKRGPQPEELFKVPETDRHERYYSIPPFIPPVRATPPSPTAATGAQTPDAPAAPPTEPSE